MEGIPLNVANDQLSDPENWVDQYGDYLYRFALSRVKDTVVAEDLVQETFLAAWRGRENFQQRSTLRTWLTGILKHKIVDHIRQSRREQPRDDLPEYADTIDAYFNENGSWQVKPAQWRTNPHDALEQKEFLDVLYVCLARMPRRLAEAFVLREMHGLDTKEVCKALNVTATNIWVMLHRARIHLRKCIETAWL